MMDRIELVAEMLRKFPGWEGVGCDDLRALVRGELGGDDVFGDGVRLGSCRRVAVPPRSALLVCAGNLPQSAWQALARLALVEVQSVCVKLPDAACADVIADAARWMGARGLFADVEVSRGLPERRVEMFDVVVVFGGNETVNFFRRLTPWNKKFLAFGHKVSLAVVNGRDVHLETARAVVRDVLEHGQQGCLSPHVCYVCDGDVGLMGAFCARAFEEAFASGREVPKWDHAAAARIFTTRRAEFALGSEVLTAEGRSLAWTVIVSASEEFEVVPTHYVLRLKPCAGVASLIKTLEPWRAYISTIAVSQHQEPPEGTGATRICAVGEMQRPSLFWSQDGYGGLAEMVTWVSFEDSVSGL